MPKPLSILLLEDSPLDAELIMEQVKRSGAAAEVVRVVTRQEFETAVKSRPFDLILSDYALPDFDGVSALREVQRKAPTTPFIFVSGTMGEEVAIGSLKNGASDYILKQNLNRLAPAITRALAEKREKELRHAAELEAHSSEARFRGLADALPQLIWTADRDGHITYCNRRAQEYAGFDPLDGNPPGLDLVHPADREELLHRWNSMRDGDRAIEAECRLRGRDGKYGWHLLRYVPTRDEGPMHCWVVVAVNIEDQKRREEALRASEAALLAANNSLESRVQERTEAYQKLSATLIQIQDEERKKFARELHDGLGQYLAGLKMNLDVLRSGHDVLPAEQRMQLLDDSIQILQRCISEARTTSYLFYPPMLEEAGFALAARWYVDGFGARSGIKTAIRLPENLGRLPQQVEVGLFRVLQESLTNVHRHSKSPRVEIELRVSGELAQLEIRDYGCGIPEARLHTLRAGNYRGGVGLAGMRERIRELSGSFEIQVDEGTRIVAAIPLRWETPALAIPLRAQRGTLERLE